jgi:disulfide bond formation protein DsbB
MPSSRITSLLVAAISAGLLLGAFAFQYLGGLAPCVLCLYQRWPHAAVILLALGAAVVSGRPRAALLALAALALVVGAGIGVFHVGVEQHWWAGTAECGSSMPIGLSVEEMTRRLMAQPVVRCDQAAWSMLGISMAGYNVLISLAAAILALAGARRASQEARP